MNSMQIPIQPPAHASVPATLLAPRDDLFSRRAARFEQHADGRADAHWMTWLAELARRQQGAFEAMRADPSPARLIGGEDELKPLWQSLYQTLCVGMAGMPLAAEGRAPLAGGALDQAGQACLRLARGEIVAGTRDSQDYLVAAAMQVAWSATAASLAAQGRAQGEAHQHCPLCGCEPVGSIVMAGEGKAGLRYLECSLCATRWHAVRAHCTLCDEGSVISYLGLEGGNAAIQAECCEHCHGYVKTYFQEKDPYVDPMADDLASVMLDVLVGQEGYCRASPNLFLAGVEAVGAADGG